jgi:hypothetical protein
MRPPRLYHQLHTLLGQPSQWADQRHLHCLIWMVIGLVCSECISLTKWRMYVQSRAVFAQSHQDDSAVGCIIPVSVCKNSTVL